MLTRFHKVLIALLVVQLVLVVVVLSRGNDAAALKEHPLLAGFDAAKVTRVQVFAKPDAKPLDLVKRDAAWVLASSFDYPVDAAKLTDVLTPVAKLSAAAPIATQAGRYKQLKVADAEFERKVVITSAGKDVTLYLGGPAGARRMAVRIGGDDNVYGVTGLSAGTVSGEPRQWVDPVYAKVPVDEIAKISVQRDAGSVALTHEVAAAPADAGSGSAAAPPPPEHWSAAIGDAPIALAAGETLDEATIARLAGQAATIDLTAPADPKRDASKPTATITIERKAAAKATAAPVVIDVIAEGTSYWVHDRSQPRAVLVDKSRLDDLLGATRDKLVKKPPPPPPAAPASPSAGGAGSAKPPKAVPPPVRPG